MSETSEINDAAAGTAASRSFKMARIVIAAGFCLVVSADPLSAQQVGPSTTIDPYVLPSMAGVETTSILTVGDLPAKDGYRMVGIPDGAGALRNGNNFTMLVSHELGAAQGVVRGHGSKGAFVSRWTIDRDNLEVLTGEDLTQSANDVSNWDAGANAYVQGTTDWDRLCSADLAEEAAYRHRNLGTRDRLFLNGEELNQGGRAWARVATGPNTGDAWELPRMGKMAYENVVASPYRQNKTVVVALDDADLDTTPGAADFPSEVYVYIGTKQNGGHPVEKAGLTNGKLYGVKVSLDDGTLVTEESNDFGLGNSGTGYIGGGKFELVELGNNGDVSNFSGRDLQDAANAADIFHMRRVEDGAWDPRRSRKGDFYFLTTGDINTNSRLWRLRFDDIEHPEQGGTIEIILKGDEGHRMLDNMTIDGCGRVLMQEDPGGNARLAKIWLYGIQSGSLIEVAHHNPKFFDPAQVGTFLTNNEEASGIIDATSILGKGWFLMDVQAHFNIGDPELVEGGQLLAMFVDRDIQCERDGDDDDDRNGDNDGDRRERAGR
jgi:hypothetical protein